MADEFQLGSGNWWDTARTTPPSISTTLNSMASFGGGAMVLHGGDDQGSGGVNGGVLVNPNLQMMGLVLSSQGMDTWNQTLLGEKGESTFRPSNFQHKLYSNTSPDQDNSSINRGFSLDHTQFSSQASSNDSTITSQNLTASGFQLDSTSGAAYCGYILPEHNPQMNNYSYPTSGYGASSAELIPSWNNKYPQFLKTSPPKQLNTTPSGSNSSHLHFTNNTPFWNASSPGPAMADDARSSFFPAHNIPGFDEKPKNTSEIRDLGTSTKKNSTEITPNKRPRNETPSPLPAFKVRKEKMGDRITALQQLVTPFGKTDTASVLSEAIDYIKFLHEQVNALSIPYMKNGAPIQYQQNCDKSNDPEGPRQDLRSRGLCLVPVSSTFPMTHETAVDFWTPTFGGSFR